MQVRHEGFRPSLNSAGEAIGVGPLELGDVRVQIQPVERAALEDVSSWRTLRALGMAHLSSFEDPKG